jgi:thiamine kinase-like enzyme
MDNETISRILQQYGYSDFVLLPIEKGYRNESHPFQLPSGQILNLILYKDEAGSLRLIRRADRSSQAAARGGLPARQVASPKIVKLQAGIWRKYGQIYTYLPGRTIPWEAYTQEHIKLLGKTLSDLHYLLQNLPPNGYPLVADQYTDLVSFMRSYFAESGVKRALVDKLQLQLRPATFNRFEQIMRACKALQHQQVLHMDFVRSNILFREDPTLAISGILDFEKTAVGHPCFDIARTLAFLLVDCKYKTELQVRKYFLYSGYVRRGKYEYHRVNIKGKDVSYPLLEALVELFLVYDFYKFLRHNPYESLLENEHFVRTRSLLLDRDLIQHT